MRPQTTRHDDQTSDDDAVDQQQSSSAGENPHGLYKRCDCDQQTTCEHSWWYRFRLNGKRYRGTTHTRQRQLAERAAGRVRGRALEGKPVRATKQSSTTLAALAGEFMQHYRRDFPASYERASSVLPRFVEFIHTHKANARVADVTKFQIDKYKLARADDVERGTVNRELNIIKSFFRKACEWKHVETSPAVDVKKYKLNDGRVRWLDDDELATLMAPAGVDADVQLVCEVTLECLPRLSEVLTLKREHVGPSWIEILRKGGAVDRIKITPALRSKLVKRCHRSGWIFGVDFPGVVNQARSARRRAARHAANPDTRVRRRAHQAGQPLTQQAATNKIRRELARLGIADASHHTMRHTGVTLMLEAGVDHRTIQKLAGWTSLRMLERYGHARDAAAARAVSTMRDVLDAARERGAALVVDGPQSGHITQPGHKTGHTPDEWASAQRSAGRRK